MIQAYVISLVLGLGFWPAINRLFTELKDGGLALSKLLGGIVIALVVWFLSYAGLAVNTNAGVFMVGSLVIIGAIVWGKIDLRKINWRVVIVEEILFALGFFGLAMVRGFNPDILDLEKFMDFGFVNSYLHSPTLPAADMWWAGNSINYYSFGHFWTSVMIRIWQVPAAVGFNLMLAYLLGLGLMLSF